MRYSICLSYDGSQFCGWQVQPDAPSVQQTLSQAISTLTGREVSVTGAGRTDSSVNAVNYIAHFDIAGEPVDHEAIGYKLNAILPSSVTVHYVKPEEDDFHARFGALQREYTYFLHRRKDPFMQHYSYMCLYNLDVEAMNEAAILLLGTHDFSCFEKVGADNKTSICTVSRAEWKSYTPTHVQHMDFPCNEGDYLMFHISADRFLRNMVRAVVGSLLDVGRGKRDIEWFRSLLQGGDRCKAGESVPGKALFLSGVRYR